MAPSKTYLWVCLALCVAFGGAEVFYKKTGEAVSMGCGNVDHNKQLEWKHNDKVVVKVLRTTSKGTTELAKKAKLSGSTLKVPSLVTADSGVFRCDGLDTQGKKVTQEHTVYVVSVYARPSETVLHSTDLNLICDIHNIPEAQLQWMKPSGKPYGSPGKDITLKSVSWTDSGTWTCQIKANEKVANMNVDITVLGPLTSPAKVTVPEGGSANLTCSLPPVSLPHIETGGWSRDAPNGPKFPTLQGGPKWNGENNPRVTFSKETLDNNFTVTLNKVKSTDDGNYICYVKFKNGKNLTTSVMLKAEKQTVPATVTVKANMWIWVGAAAGLVLLIGLVIFIVLIHRRNKRMRRKVRKLRSIRQGLTATNYCQCDRTNRQPHPGKRERPPPLPRYLYDVMD